MLHLYLLAYCKLICASQESLKFMRHGRRTRLKAEDIDHAFKVRNIEVRHLLLSHINC